VSRNRLTTLPTDFGKLKRLQELDIQTNPIADDVVPILQKLSKRSFILLQARGTKLSEEGVEAIRNALPKVGIWHNYQLRQ
jgi:hypothetical protein